MTRKDMQWMRVAQYTPMYMGVGGAPERAIFISDDNDMRDGDGGAYDCDGNTAGYWKVWPNFPAFRRDNPATRFADDGYIWAD